MHTEVVAVLHLEDSDLDAELIRDRLERSGLPLALERVGDRAGFVERITARRYDLILSDYQIPSFEGLEALELAKRHQPEAPFIFVSGALGEEVAVETLRHGATDYILKERLARLVPAVERAMSESRERAERRRTEDRLRVALAAGRMGTWSLNLATGRMECSDSCRANYGRGPGERFTYEDLAAAVLDEDRPQWQRAVAQAVERGTDFAIEYRTRWPDGSVHWVHVRGSCVTFGGQTVSLSGVSIDVTARRQAEEERERLLTELARREEELRLVTDAVPALISYIDASGVYRFANHAYEVWFGHPREEVVGRHLSEVLGEEVYRVIRPGVERALRGEQNEFETFAAYRDGGGRYIHVNYVPRFEGGQVVGFYALVTDISPAKRAEEALRDADRRKDEFLATLAHELRNPLAPIRNALQVVKLSDQRAVRERAWGTMERQVVQMVRLVDDLLDVSRITRSKLDLLKERLDVAAVVHQAVETARPHVEKAGHELSVALPPGPVYLDGDPVRLAQVFANLLNNAAKYTEPGGRIRLTVERQANDVVVSIRDTGVGIPAEMLPRVFELFTQVDASRDKAQGGLGIGLTLVRRLVEMHGGSVEARSDGPGHGSEFVVRLPLPLDARVADRSNPSGLPAVGPRRSILVADDNRDGAESLAEMLRLMGNEVRTVHDGLQAVRAAEEFRPDVVLLDVGMPQLNGHDAARRIRTEAWGKGIVVIAVTGWGQDADKRKSLEAGCDLHLVKPVNPVELVKLLGTVVPVQL